MASATTLLTMTLKTNNDNHDEYTTKKRRKQSKPSRIQSTDEQQYIPMQEQPQQMQQQHHHQQEMLPTDDLDFVFPLNLSSTTSSTIANSTTKDIAVDSPILSVPAATINATWPNNYLTNQLSQQILLPNFKRLFTTTTTNATTTATTATTTATTLNTIMDATTHRIFNPEAFCDLCKKEFCNKYFLKTHKANKHGIYMENITQMDLNVPLLNYFPMNNATATNATTINASISTINIKKSTVLQTTQQQTTQQPQQQQTTPQQTAPQQQTVKANSLQANTLNASSMRTLCNICHREFCNKYFVRRHKAKIHGIVEQLTDEERLHDEHQTAMLLNSSIPGPSTNQDLIKKELYLDDENESLAISSPTTIATTTTTTTTAVQINYNQTTQQALSLLVTSSTWSNDESKDSLSKSPERMQVKKNSAQITGSTAFCDICCKEYCNKYFLRVHKQKCHGFMDKNISNPSMPLNLILRETTDENSSTSSNNPNALITCNLCPATFPDLYLMKLHFEQMHNNERDDKNEVQKLHTMILNLQQEQENFCCEICKKDMCNLTLLENHIIKEHSNLVEELSNGFNSEYSTRNQFILNAQENHKNFVQIGNYLDEKLTDDTERNVQHTPTSSFCEICKKELCNKYFMKTHMQRMHGISIENGAQIGGVVCDICNKELCSKYFLRVHKQNSHGIVEESLLPQVNDIKQSPDPLKPQDTDLQHRYFSHFTEVCTICSRRFRSVKWLKAHLLNDHGDEGRDKWKDMQRPDKKGHTASTSYNSQEPILHTNFLGNKYQCSYCPFVTPILTLLLVHERSHIGQETLDSVDTSTNGESQETMLGLRCPRCIFSTSQLESYTDHVNQVHGEDCPPLLSVLKDTILQLSSTSLLPAVYSLPAKTITATTSESATATAAPTTTSSCVTTSCNITSTAASITTTTTVISNNATTTATATSASPTATCQQQYIMQPFLLEDPNASFITTLIYLPVKDRLSEPITTSFRLTPT